MTDPFTIRPARDDDRAAVLAFCTQTWDWGDYLDWAWDDWMADPRGLFAVGTLGERVVGVDKLTFLSADEAFFEGLRVDPAYRGHGYAERFEAHMLGEAARQGARVVRFLTAVDNGAVHKIAGRHGFQPVATLAHWSAEGAPAPEGAAPPLQPLTPGPAADAAWTRLTASPLTTALHGLASMRWHVQAWTPDLWAAAVAAGDLWTLPGPGPTPAGVLALLPGADPADAWLAGLTATPFDADPLTALATGARAVATAQGRPNLQAMLPALPPLDAGLRAAGWTSDGVEHGLLVFEKPL